MHENLIHSVFKIEKKKWLEKFKRKVMLLYSRTFFSRFLTSGVYLMYSSTFVVLINLGWIPGRAVGYTAGINKHNRLQTPAFQTFHLTHWLFPRNILMNVELCYLWCRTGWTFMVPLHAQAQHIPCSLYVRYLSTEHFSEKETSLYSTNMVRYHHGWGVEFSRQIFCG